ncbi:MAG: ferritin-like domain-containing protein [Actinomyces sp.]|nr:MAG: ferritin-like domain-containing protein [Actinomyces sp.]
MTDTADRTEAFEELLAVTGDDAGAVIHSVADNADAIFTWDYGKGERRQLDRLYEKAKTSQWNATTDLDWSAEVDPQKVAIELTARDHRAIFIQRLRDLPGSPVSGWTDAQFDEFSRESFAWRLAQFMHGEQGALLCTAKIVETVPWIDAKYYAATQVVDEARHVEVFSRYLNEKVGIEYPVNHHLQALLDDIIDDSRWDITYLGMQIMVEGLALAAFGTMHHMTEEPLLKTLLRYVMSDEARHVAFGVLSLQEVYAEMDAAEIRERQEFAFEAALRMRDRFLQQEVWERLGVDVKAMVAALLAMPPEENLFQQMLFAKIVPNCKKLGLLDAGDGWLRQKFTEIGIIQFEDGVSTDEEYGALDEVARDRAAAVS